MNGSVSVIEVQAQWAYSEIVGGTLASNYNNVAGIVALRARRQANVPFASLSQAEVQALAMACMTVRPNMMIFFQSVQSFHLQQLDKVAIGQLWVPPMAIGVLQCWPFSYYVTTQHSSPQDARNVACTPATYVPPPEPITVGISPPQQHVLIDGYHRAVAFYRCGPATGSIPAYIPDTPAATTQPTP
jgi:hypothetical protein